MMDRVWLDNSMIPKDDARVPALEEGVLAGCGLFETMRCYEGKVFALGRHLDRLIKSCPVLGMRVPSKSILEKAVKSVIVQNRLTSAALRLNVLKKSRGACGIFVFSRKLSLPKPAQYEKGFSCVLFKDERIGRSPLNNVKSLNHYFYQRLSKRAREKGFDEGIFLNGSGEIVEGSRTNIFLVKGSIVKTPGLSCGCLAGITRAVVMGLLKKMKVPVRECGILPGELFEQNELFLTNSLIEIMPVTRLDKKPIGKGKPGSLTQEIMALYKKEVEKECLMR